MVKINSPKVFSPTSVGSASSNSVFVDSDNNLRFKNSNSVVKDVNSPFYMEKLGRYIGQKRIEQDIDRSVSSGTYDNAFIEAYVDSNGRHNSIESFETVAVFDTNKYKATNPFGTYYVIIEASNISYRGDFQINDCDIIQVDSGKWVLYGNSASDTDEVKRAKIIKTLFYGTDGTNPRASSSYITGITALKTTYSDDVGRRAYYLYLYSHLSNAYDPDDPESGYYEGTFSNTTDNIVDGWSYLSVSDDNNGPATFYLPSSTTVNNVGGGPSTSDEIGTDTTGDQSTNPTNVKLFAECDASDNQDPASTTAKAIILTKDTISWTTSGDLDTYSKTDFYSDNNIPDFTDGSSESFSATITHYIPYNTFSSGISRTQLVFKADDWEDGDSVSYKIIPASYSLSSSEVSNYSFEDSIGSEWTEGGSGFTVGRASDKASAGSWSYKFYRSNDSSSETTAYIEQSVDTTSWDTLYIDKIFYLSNARYAYFYVYINDVVVLSQYQIYNYSDSDWVTKEIKVPVSLRQKNSTLKILFIARTDGYGGGTATLWVDNIRVKKRVLSDTDTGWLSAGSGETINTFSALTYQPYILKVKLVPKSSTPTNGYPSINGICLIGE